MAIRILAFLFSVTLSAQAYANDLIEQIENLDTEVGVTSTTVFNPPLLDGTYRFLAFSANENPYPSPISYEKGKTLADRANFACSVLAGTSAISVILDQITDPNGEYLAYSHTDVAMVDLFLPSNVRGVAYMKKLTCR